MKKVTFNILTFAELSPEAKLNAVENEINYCMEEHDWDLWTPNMKKASEEADRKRSPDLFEKLAWKYCENEATVRLSNPQYSFFSDGELYIEEEYPKE